MAELIIRSGKHRGKRLKLPDTEVVIGRDEQCHVRLVTGDVSRRHCALRCTAEGMVVRDLGSSNGTLVNEVRIDAETLLKPGDTLTVGPMNFEVPGNKHGKQAKQKEKAAAVSVPHSREKETPEETPSADDIAAWLMGEESDEADAGSTTIIRGTTDDEPPETKHLGEEPRTDAEIPTAGSSQRKKFKSLADEAADVIRRWHEIAAQQDQ